MVSVQINPHLHLKNMPSVSACLRLLSAHPRTLEIETSWWRIKYLNIRIFIASYDSQ